MKTIWKWELPRPRALNTRSVIEMPQDTEILCAQEHNGNIAIWGVVETDNCNQLVKRELYLSGSGQLFDFTGKYIGTIQFDQGAWVVHVFVY